ncbi:hypothetical protein D7Y15_08095 [Corallococcus sp. AB030]|uniref:hypothetical protein n=1 Tax=unclassified Corallococcus TaxID=2685029 RepID=UPI000EA34D1B|nr:MULTISPECIES: hypothetical protein [unclassified Corallococcus]RKG68669.1 hypothetical protein D7V80_11775 [Corallococcus sp. CA054B]RKI18649.1 hypothetical protein D7Y15_08095 [Corallococcus sp. AB030]
MKLSAFRTRRDLAIYPNQEIPGRFNRYGSLVQVTRYADQQAKRVYEVDEEHMLYREADLTKVPAVMGEWKPLEP